MEKLKALRKEMEIQGIDAWVIPHTDAHQSEYIADYWKIIPWLSGFDGSAGTLVITNEFAGLWTDSRYFIQAEAQVADSGFELMKLKVPHQPEYIDWLAEHMPEKSVVGIDQQLISVSRFEQLEESLQAQKISIQLTDNLIGPIWTDRPPMPSNPLLLHEDHFAGLSRVEKLIMIRRKMAEKGIDYHLLTSLDDIAWLLNIRGTDVAYNPVCYCYALISVCDATLFIDQTKIPDDIKETFSTGLYVEPYSAIGTTLSALKSGQTLHLDPAKTSMGLYAHIPMGIQVSRGMQPTTPLKGVKNEREIEQIRSTMIKDGVAMVTFLHWLKTNVGKEEITEYQAAEKLTAFRAEQAHFVGPSFQTIPGYKGNGAIVHYGTDATNQVFLQPEGLFLLDSGGQYLDGTTDITRTIALGEPSEAEKRDYTLVLKGHIALATAVFPAGTKGYQLEGLARRNLWQHGLNYGHGTGHGVGFFLNVHEGPQAMGTGSSGNYATALEPGMLTSNEPGVYHSGKYGIRIENLILCIEKMETEFGKFYGFETVTLCPLDRQLIELNLLDQTEINWINAYHSTVKDQLHDLLPAEIQAFLQSATEPL